MRRKENKRDGTKEQKEDKRWDENPDVEEWNIAQEIEKAREEAGE
ncbi:MAG: hypothetical protein ACM3IJ_05550 [Candidatus Levyibacteriota bacterium]